MIPSPAFFSVPLAAVPTDPAQLLGYYIGIALVIVVFVGAVIFGIVAIVKALTQRTAGWIVAGAISGFVVLALGALFAIGVVRGFTQARATALKAKAETGETVSGAAQKITGKEVFYTLQLTDGWKVQRKSGAFDVLAMRRGSYLGVIAEEADLGENAVVAESAQKRIADVATDVELGESKPAEIDGRPWLGFTVKCKVDKVPLNYQFYVHTDAQGTFQLLGWTTQNLWERESGKIRETMQTFHFPPAAKPAAVAAEAP